MVDGDQHGGGSSGEGALQGGNMLRSEIRPAIERQGEAHEGSGREPAVRCGDRRRQGERRLMLGNPPLRHDRSRLAVDLERRGFEIVLARQREGLRGDLQPGAFELLGDPGQRAFGARRAIAMRPEALVALHVGIERGARQGIGKSRGGHGEQQTGDKRSRDAHQKRSDCTNSDGSSDIRTYWARMWISD
jgi:hypothetical protein